jgi:hypothetical protein
VLGESVITELARTYQMNRTDAQDRGQKLFQLLYSQVCAGIPVIKPTWALLIEEALNVSEGRPVTLFADDTYYPNLKNEVEKLRSGLSDSKAVEFINSRRQEARDSRSQMKAFFGNNQFLGSALRSISSGELDSWLDTQEGGKIGCRFVAAHLQVQFPENSREELLNAAAKLLSSRRYRVSRALARTDMYVNWRFAHHGSLPADLPDDLYHLVNGSHCDIFLTADHDLSNHVRRLLRDVCVVYYCDGDGDLLRWIKVQILEHRARISSHLVARVAAKPKRG